MGRIVTLSIPLPEGTCISDESIFGHTQYPSATTAGCRGKGLKTPIEGIETVSKMNVLNTDVIWRYWHRAWRSWSSLYFSADEGNNWHLPTDIYCPDTDACNTQSGCSVSIAALIGEYVLLRMRRLTIQVHTTLLTKDCALNGPPMHKGRCYPVQKVRNCGQLSWQQKLLSITSMHSK